MGKNQLHPNCVVDTEKSTAGKVLITCQPRKRAGNRVYGSPRPMRFLKEEADELAMIDDGGASSDLIKDVKNHLKKHTY
ncbi:MAG: hypothetical protein QME12_07340 [Nanoarchaeota archaeon]|nr:hypothetical protein [Nanoarchaeota archaeon]